MSLATFRHALDAAGDCVTLGGGEPTLHPKFWQILGEAIATADSVWLATNGSITKTALALAKLAEKGVIGCDLSQDCYHDPINEKVVEAFRKNTSISGRGINGDNDWRGVRNVNGNEIKAGRSKTGTEECFCNELIVKPDGTIMGCACPDAPILGNINDKENEILWHWESGSCWEDQPFEVLEELKKKRLTIKAA